MNEIAQKWRCERSPHAVSWRCEMTSLVNKSTDWPPNYHKILIFSPTKIFEKVTRSQNRWNIKEWKNSTCWLVLVVIVKLWFSVLSNLRSHIIIHLRQSNPKCQIPYYLPLNQWLLGATNSNQGIQWWTFVLRLSIIHNGYRSSKYAFNFKFPIITH